MIAAYEQHCEAFECWTTGQLEDFVKALTRPIGGGMIGIEPPPGSEGGAVVLRSGVGTAIAPPSGPCGPLAAPPWACRS